MFLITFKTGHALLLPGGRFLNPRMGRETGAKQSRMIKDSWPQTRLGHERRLVWSRAQPRILHLHEQSSTTFIPHQRMRRQSVRSRDLESVLTRYKQTLASDINSPRTVCIRELTTSINPAWLAPFPVLQPATSRSRSRIVPTYARPVSFPVQIKVHPFHAHF